MIDVKASVHFFFKASVPSDSIAGPLPSLSPPKP